MATIFKDIVGSDRGFNVAADVLTTTADGVSLNSLWAEYSQAMEIWNQSRNLIARLFTFDTTATGDLLPIDGGSWEFEQQTEFGKPMAGRVTPEHYRIGFPLEWFDTATRFTRKFLRDATREQVDAQNTAAITADNRMLFRKTLTALTTKSDSTSRVMNEIGLPIYSLYSGLSDDTPPEFAGRTFAAGHTHYFTSGAATIDGQDLVDLIEHIQHHGYGNLGSGERIVVLVNPAQGTTIRGLRVATGSPYDFIPSEAAPAFLTTETVVGQKPPTNFNGLPIIGSFGSALIFESMYIPSGYVIAVATSGPNSPRNPLAFRQHPRPESQGLRLIPGVQSSERYPLIESIYERGFGVGVRNRGAAAVLQIKASGTYDNPVWP